jgi:hypothetical protein
MDNPLTRPEYRILVDGELVPATLIEWGRWFEHDENRIIARMSQGNIMISTVCLGVNHGFGKRPLWFETMVFRNGDSSEMERYETLEEAMRGHERMVAQVFGQRE